MTLPEFKGTGLTWEELDRIERDHAQHVKELTDVADVFVNMLQRVEAVHSVRVRVKSPGGLVAKIIRKRIEAPARVIGIDNYRREITDLIGVRALHLFKDQWLPIHKHIKSTCTEHEPPVAYHRAGDPEALLKEFATAGCTVEVHPAGYRSVHYVIASQPVREVHLIEVQVRTVFEEAWAEIDHLVRYPRKTEDKVLAAYLSMFNSYAGNADAISTLLMTLQRHLQKLEEGVAREQTRAKEAEAQLKRTVSQLNINEKQKEDLRKQIAAATPSFMIVNPQDVALGATPAVSLFDTVKINPTLFLTTAERVCPQGHRFSPLAALRTANGYLCPQCGLTVA